MDKKLKIKKLKWKFWSSKNSAHDSSSITKQPAVSQKRLRVKRSFATAIYEGNFHKFNDALDKYAGHMVDDDVYSLILRCMNADEPDLKHDNHSSGDISLKVPLHPVHPHTPPLTRPLGLNPFNDENSFLETALDHITLPEFYGNHDLTPIHVAVKLNKVKAVTSLLDANPKQVNQPTKSDQKVPLHFTVENDSVNLVELLLKRGANVKAKDIYGNNVLHAAVSRGAVKVVDYLLKHTVGTDGGEAKTLDLDINLPNNNGWTPLHIAAEGGSEKMCELLLRNGVYVDVKTTGGKTALHWASMSNSLQCVSLLLEHSADVNAVDNFGKTAYNYTSDMSIKRLISADVTSSMEKKAKSDFVPLKKIKVRIDPRSDSYWRVFSINEHEKVLPMPTICVDSETIMQRKSQSLHGRTKPISINIENAEDVSDTHSSNPEFPISNKIKFVASESNLLNNEIHANAHFCNKISNSNVNTNNNNNHNNITITVETRNDMNRSENTLTTFLMEKLRNARSLTNSISSFKSFCNPTQDSKNNSNEDKISELPKSLSSDNTPAKLVLGNQISRSTTSPSESGIFEQLSVRDDDDGDLNIFTDSSNLEINALDFATNCKFQCLSVTYSQIHRVIVNSLKHNCESFEMKRLINNIMKNFKSSSAVLEKFTLSILLLVRNPDEVWLKVCSQNNFKSLASYETLLFIVGKMVALFQDCNEFCRCQGCVDRLMLLFTLFIMQHTSENCTPIKLTVSVLKNVMPSWITIKEDLYKLLITEILKFYENKRDRKNDKNTNDLIRDIYARMTYRKRKIFDPEYCGEENLFDGIESRQLKNDFCEFIIETVESDQEWIFDI